MCVALRQTRHSIHRRPTKYIRIARYRIESTDAWVVETGGQRAHFRTPCWTRTSYRMRNKNPITSKCTGGVFPFRLLLFASYLNYATRQVNRHLSFADVYENHPIAESRWPQESAQRRFTHGRLQSSFERPAACSTQSAWAFPPHPVPCSSQPLHHRQIG